MPADYLRSSGGMNMQRRTGLPGCNRGHGRGARPGSRGFGFTRAPLVETHLKVTPVRDLHEFHVHAFRENLLAADLPAQLPPMVRKFGSEHHKMRIARGDRHSMNLAPGSCRGKTFARFWNTHLH